MDQNRALTLPVVSRGDRHGCFDGSTKDGWYFGGVFRLVCLVLVSSLCFCDTASAGLRLYISDSDGSFLEVVDNNAQGSDLNAAVDFISVSASKLSLAFTGWTFNKVTAESSLGVNLDDQAVRRLNVQFDVVNQLNRARDIEIKVLYTGALSLDLDPTAMNLFANGKTYQVYDGTLEPAPTPPDPLDVRFSGAFNQDETGSYLTNNYDDLVNNGSPWVLGAQGNDIFYQDIGPNGERSFNVVEPYQTTVTPEGLFSMTLASKVFSLGQYEGYGFQADLEITLPEPVSSAGWILLGGGLAVSRWRRRLSATR